MRRKPIFPTSDWKCSSAAVFEGMKKADPNASGTDLIKALESRAKSTSASVVNYGPENRLRLALYRRHRGRPGRHPAPLNNN